MSEARELEQLVTELERRIDRIEKSLVHIDTRLSATISIATREATANLRNILRDALEEM